MLIKVNSTRRKAVQTAGGALLAHLFGVTSAVAQNFPEKPIRIIPFGSGGGPIDVIARLYGDKLRQMLGQPVLVDPKPGASGIIAADFVAKAPRRRPHAVVHPALDPHQRGRS